MSIEDRARTAAQVMWLRGLISTSQISAAAEVVAIYMRDLKRDERERLSHLAFDVPEPHFEDHPRQSQIVAIEAYRRAIRKAE